MLRALQRLGVRRGVVGGSRLWLWVAVTTAGLRLVKRVLGRTEKVVFSQELKPGETLVIAHERDASVVSPGPT